MAVDLETQKAWARTWQATGEALEKIRRAELRALTPEKALAATDKSRRAAAALRAAAAVNPILGTALEVQLFCRSRGWRFCFIGAIAVQRWGEPRLTWS